MNLLYLTFGDNIRNHTQAYFSIYSFLAKGIQPASLNIITDKPWYYKSIEKQVNIIEANAALLQEWMGPYQFFWRVKIKAIEKLCRMYTGEPVLYLDSDTFFYGTGRDYENLSRSEQAIMFENEGPLKELPSKTMKTMSAQLKNLPLAGLSNLSEWNMWNAGVVFTPNRKDAKEMELALALCDGMCGSKVKDQFAEQFALSVALQHLYGLRSADNAIAHYWSNKEQWNEVIRTFFIECQMLGLDFEEQLKKYREINVHNYPVVRISRSTNRKLKQKVDQIFSDKKIEYLKPPLPFKH
ncbi:hypothetical protein ACTJIJ_04570 [Niabella sp. 22666]|uniref:hypothetical protein n=1 Tax=Niabella sp. 22666 TaxID=3453954 RepID=UPI003F82F1B0